MNSMNKKLTIIFIIMLSMGTISPYISNFPVDTIVDDTTTLRVMTFNIHYGIEPLSSYNVEKIGDLVEMVKPDVIGFQEVTVNSPLNGMANLYGDLQNILLSLGYSYSYISEAGSHYLRNAIFSIHPILSSQTFYFTEQTIYQRSLVEVKIDYKNEDIFVWNTHLEFPQTEDGSVTRMSQIEDVLEIYDVRAPNKLIFTGDFNANPDDPEILSLLQSLVDAYNLTNPGVEGLTYPSDGPEDRFDYIFISPLLQPLDCEILQTTISDHLPVVCNIDI